MHELWSFLGWRDVQKQYSRSVLGPLWLTLSMGVMIAGLGLLYSTIFRLEIANYLPFLTVGFIVWGLMSGMLNAACFVFSGVAASIRQVHMPLSIYVLQLAWTQLIVFAHNFIIFILVAVIFGIWPGLNALLFVPALLLITLSGIFAALILGPLCARFRDVPMIVASVLQIAFFMTPIIWSAEQLPERAFFVALNPFYHYIEIARGPLLGTTGSLMNWLVCLGITAGLGIVAFLFFSRYRARVAYWV